jgi:hypothetical protein
MSEHLIRLRAAWQWRPRDAGVAAPRRIDLPTAWPAEWSGPILLTRGFHGPRLEPGCQRVRLRLEAVAGLRSVRLNGLEVARPEAGTSALTLDLEGRLHERNVLVLEVDRAAAADPGAGATPWGTIALVIVPAGTVAAGTGGLVGETGRSGV